MRLDTPELLDSENDNRARVAEELGRAMERLALDMPHMDAALMLRLGIGFFAGVHARHFGHAATIKALIRIARRGLWFAAEELNAPRH